MQGMDPPVGLDAEQRAAWLRDRDFLAQLTDSSRRAQRPTPANIDKICTWLKHNFAYTQ